MKNLLTYKNLIGVSLLLIAVVFVAVFLYTKALHERYLQTALQELSSKEANLTKLAALINSNQATEDVDAIITDCSLEYRVAFDEDLGRLAELRGNELIEMEKLFNACGSYFAVKNAVMVALLQAEYNAYEALLSIISTVDPSAAEKVANPLLWKERVASEKMRSDLSLHLVDVQGRIIEGLREGLAVDSDLMQTMLVEGQETKKALTDLSLKIQKGG